MSIKQLSYQIRAEDVSRLDVFLAKILSFSRARVRGLIDHDCVQRNSQPCHDYGTILTEADTIEIRYDPERKYREKPPVRKPTGFSIVFQDQHLVVVNKEAGILTVPTDRREKNSLIDLLSNYLAAGQSRAPRVSVVHRLDRDTSGILVFGQRQAIADHLIQQFSARKPNREYYAIVAGKLSQDRGEIRSLLHTDKALNQKSGASGDLAITHYRVISRYKDSTLVAVNLETGRRNQIRVHFAEMGHPILGDQRYQAERAAHPSWPHRRLALHARMLGFSHPISRRELCFETELPREFDSYPKD